MAVYALDKLMSEARRLAAEYRRTTGKSLGISGEIAKHDACRLLGLEPHNGPAGGFDAVGRGPRAGRRIQIKGRAVFDERKGGQRIGQLKLDQDWDSLILVVMDENFEPDAIYEAPRARILEALEEAPQSGRHRRGAMSVARFRKLADRVWAREAGPATEPTSRESPGPDA